MKVASPVSVVRQKCVHVSPQVLPNQIRNLGRQHNAEACLGNIPAHHFLRVGIENRLGRENFRPRNLRARRLKFRSGHNDGGRAIGEPSRVRRPVGVVVIHRRQVVLAVVDDVQRVGVAAAHLLRVGQPGHRRPGDRDLGAQPAVAVEQRVRRDGYDRVNFGSVSVDNRPGRNDWVVGELRALGRRGPEELRFSCSVDLRSGDVRSVDVTRR